ncbi:MAG TPA: sigma-70 family RNA polymerase sigma factor [Polyangiaceae bacterium]|jgi:RNA polymerase sigma-70 factor (ECF subfamily)
MTFPLSHDAVSLEALARRGAQEAAPELSRDVLDMLYRQMRVLAGPRRDLDDLVQAAAERLIRALPHFEGRSSLSTFAYGVAYRTLLSQDRWFRRWSRRFSLAEEGTTGDRESLAETTEDAAVRAQRAESLHRALSQLPPPKRAVIVLHDLEGMEMKEVASVVEANERTVRSRLRDGRKRLAALLVADPLFDREAP